MRDVIDEIFYRRRADLIAVISITIAVAFTIRGARAYGQSVVLAKIGNNLVARYQQRLFDHLMKLGVGFFNDLRSAHLAAQINQNVNGIRDLLGMTITSVARDLVSLLALAGVMIWQDWLLSLIALLIGPPLIYAVNYLMRRLRRITRESVEVNSRLLGAMQEATQGITIVKAFTMERELSAKLAALIAHAEYQANKIARVSERVSPIAETLAGFAVAGVIAYAGYRALNGIQPPGAVFSFITALLLAYDPARRLARMQVNLERVAGQCPHDLRDPRPRAAPARRVRRAAARSRRRRGPLRPCQLRLSPGHAGARRRQLRRGGRQDHRDRRRLGRRQDDAGGAAAALLRPRRGPIAIDGQDIAGVTKATLRGSIAYVSQQPYLFEGTIRDNIRYGRPDATDAEVEAAGEDRAGRRVHPPAAARLRDDGRRERVTLSGGQRQRLSIARAIVRNAPILVLDEATSALDNESEALVQAALAEVMKGRTTIVIAHRLSTVINADHIVVLAHGKLVEEGTHRQLIANPHGAYARFHGVQTDKGLGLVDDLKVAPIAAAPQEEA